jgi:hypothetical protein
MFRIISFCLGLIVGVIAMTFSDTCRAGTLGLHTWSEHGKATYQITHEGGAPEERKFNEDNFGLYYIGQDNWIVGAYKNSYYRNTVYAGYVIDGPTFRPLGVQVKPALAAALATGYRRLEGVGTLRVMLMPQVVVHTGYGTAVRYSLAPGKRGMFQHLSIERSF